jgi:hypothetical protein
MGARADSLLKPNLSIDTDAHVRPCAARTRLMCAGHFYVKPHVRALSQ